MKNNNSKLSLAFRRSDLNVGLFQRDFDKCWSIYRYWNLNKVTIEVLSVTRSYSLNSFNESNDLTNAFDLKIIKRFCPVHPRWPLPFPNDFYKQQLWVRWLNVLLKLYERQWKETKVRESLWVMLLLISSAKRPKPFKHSVYIFEVYVE